MATKRMLVDATHPEETRIVVTSGNRLEEFDFESATRRQLRGNIYLAKVTRVEPSLQAAFVDYGGNRHGFLAFSEIHPDYYQIPVADREALIREEQEAEAAAQRHETEDSDNATATTQPAAEGSDAHEGDEDAHFDEAEENGSGNGNVEQAPSRAGPVESIGSGDALEEMRERRRSTNRRNYKIQEVIKRRQVMLVQVVKEERGNKGAALTTYLSLAGRYSVLMPNTARGGGISRKITSATDRKRLKDIVGDLEVPPGQGVILRTAGASRTKAEVKRDFEYLQRLWENVRQLTLQSTAPCPVYEEGSLIKRTIRDLYSKEIDELLVSGEDAYREAKDFMRMIMPSHAKNVQLYKEDAPIFSRYGVESQLDQMFSPQVTLPSGGYIVINPTEALVSIDVNSGRATKEHNIEDTALQTNLEAAEEVSRQLRLRDLAGLIVIDFIDMSENRSNRAVERRLKDCLKNDRARIQVGRISHFGLLEMSRQRIRFGVIESSTHKCEACQGTGLVRSVESIALMVMRQVEEHVLRKPGVSINVKVPTDVALYILNLKRGTLNALEAKHGLSITLVADDHVGPAHFAIERGAHRVSDYRDHQAAAHVRVDTAAFDADVAEDEEAEEEEAETVGASEGERAEGERGGRRRRRRRGRGGDRPEERSGERPAERSSERRAEAAVEADAGAEEADDTEGQPAEALSGERSEDDDQPRRRRRRGRRGGRRNRRPEDEAADRIESNGDASAASVSEVVDDADEADNAADVSVATTDAPAGEALHGRAVDDEEPVAEKPKRARRSRRKADADTAAEAVATEAEVAQAAPAEAPVAEDEGEAPAAKKPARRSRKKAVATEAETADATAAPVNDGAEAAPAPAAEAEPADAPAESGQAARRPRKDLPADEIVVSSTGAQEEQPKPKKGWWNRGFFG